MDSLRQQKVARLLQKELGEYFRSNTKLHFDNVLITVTVVRVSSDMGVAKVYLSVFMSKSTKETLEKVNLQKWAIRKFISTVTRAQLRIVPEFIFYIDDSLDYSERIDQLLKK